MVLASSIYIYIRVYVDSHSLGQPALASKRTASDINESNWNMQPITIIQFAVRVGAYVHCKN